MAERAQGDQAGFQNPVAGFGVTFKAMFKKRLTEQYPEQQKTTAPALPRPAPAQPPPGRPGEVRRLRAVRLGLPRRRDLRRGRGQHRGGALLPGRALRPRLPDQLRALHPVRPVHRGVPHPGADDDERVRTRRLQPREPDLHQGAAARRPRGGHGRQPARDLPGHRRAGLLPRPGDRGRARHGRARWPSPRARPPQEAAADVRRGEPASGR